MWNYIAALEQHDEVESNLIREIIEQYLKPHGIAILDFFYDKKHFGNIVLTIEDASGESIECVDDRGSFRVGYRPSIVDFEYDDSTPYTRALGFARYIVETLDK